MHRSVMLEVNVGKRSLSSVPWYLSDRSLLHALMMCCASWSSLIFCLRSIVGAFWRLASGGASPWDLASCWSRGGCIGPCTLCSTLPRADCWPWGFPWLTRLSWLHRRLLFPRYLKPPPGVRLTCVESLWRSSLESMFRVEDIGCCPSSCTSAL
jgi:hypothetical protein